MAIFFNNGISKVHIDIWHIYTTTHYFCTANFFIPIEINSALNHEGNYFSKENNTIKNLIYQF